MSRRKVFHAEIRQSWVLVALANTTLSADSSTNDDKIKSERFYLHDYLKVIVGRTGRTDTKSFVFIGR